MLRLLIFLFPCRHLKTTWPITPKQSRTYVVCLECGKEFGYDWSRMRILE